jgi:protein-tyrosine phosphatase
VVDDWLSEMRGLGIRSIICLLADDQLSFYSKLPDGLLRHYQEAGFQVAHIPAEDHLRPPLSPSQLAAVWSAYQRLTKPVLVHCSAGISRSGAAVEHIMSQVRHLAAEIT